MAKAPRHHIGGIIFCAWQRKKRQEKGPGRENEAAITKKRKDLSSRRGSKGVDCNGVCGSGVTEDACGVCGGDDASCAGCTDETASNYDPSAIVDNGSCEYNTCIGDLNEDLLVSVADILVILGTFGCLENCEDDLSSDGTVGVEDLLILLSNFGQDCE